MEPLVKISNLTVRYGSHTALSGAEFAINRHDFIGIIGPNGGGKTTLVKAIMGLVKPSAGSIKKLPSMRTGYMPQHRTLDTTFPITVRELVHSGLMNSGKLRQRINSEQRNYCRELLRTTGIEGIAEKSIGQLSGGQLQRAMLCRSIISRPDLLILDEPTTYVDSRFQENFYTILERLNSSMAIIIVSHDLGTICSHVRSVCCINTTLHHHPAAELTSELLSHYDCPLKIVAHGEVAHTVLTNHNCCK